MAIGIQNYPNIIPADSDYLYGRIKDNPGDGSGTPVNAKTNGDIQEFFAKLMGLAGITPNGLPDNEYSGHQYILALNKFINTNVGSDIIRGLLGGYTANDVVVLWGCSVTANIGGTSSVTQGAIFYNDVVYKVAANSSIASPTNTLVWKIDSSVQPNIIYLANGAIGSGIADYNASTVKYFNSWQTSTSTSGASVTGGSVSSLNRKWIKLGNKVILHFNLAGGNGATTGIVNASIPLPINATNPFPYPVPGLISSSGGGYDLATLLINSSTIISLASVNSIAGGNIIFISGQITYECTP